MTDNDPVMLRCCVEVLVGAIVVLGLLIFFHDVWKMWRGK